MKRRDFLQSTGALARHRPRARACDLVSPPKRAVAQSKRCSYPVSESRTPTISTSTASAGYEVSWNCYDRLISHEMKGGPERQRPITDR